MTLAIMGIGIAGSGKTTALKHLAGRYGLAYISRDDLMEKLTGNPHQQAGREAIGNVADNLALIELGRAPGLIFDSTFVDPKKRARKIIHLRLIGADRVVGIFFDTSIFIARRRNRARNFIVPDNILREQYRMLERDPPSRADGFDELYSAEELPLFEKRELRSF